LRRTLGAEGQKKLSGAGDRIAVSELSKNDLARMVKTLQDDDVVGFVAMTA